MDSMDSMDSSNNPTAVQIGHNSYEFGPDPFRRLFFHLDTHIDVDIYINEKKNPTLPPDCHDWILVRVANLSAKRGSLLEYHAPDCDDATALAVLRYLIIYFGI